MPGPDVINRAQLVTRVLDSPAPVVAICAPAGYGKTTLLAQCAAAVDRPVAWVSLDASDNDPVLLLAELATAMNQIVRVNPLVFKRLLFSGPAISAEVLPRLLNDLTRGPSLVLILDDLHVVRTREALDALTRLCDHLPAGTKLVVASREVPPLPLARLRAHGLLLELGPADLALAGREARRVLELANVRLEPDVFDLLYERTEGWPAGIQLAAVAAGATPNPNRAIHEFGGDDRSIFDYLSSEVLASQPAERLAFLLHTSILDRFSASLCDAVLERDDSAAVMAELEHSTGFLVPLDRRREWYRYHHLFADMLKAALARTDPEVIPSLHDRAAYWCERHEMAAEAIEHALASPNRRHAAELFARNVRVLFNTGRQATIRRWIQAFSDADLAAYPPAAAGAAWVMGQFGDRAVRRFIHMLEQARSDGPFPLGEGSSRSEVALLKAAFAWEGVNHMRALTETAYRLESAGAEAHDRAALLLGVNLLLRGRFEAAQERLEEAAGAGEAGATTAVFALGLLALMHLEARRFEQAAARIDEGLALLERAHLQGYTVSAAVFVACAWLDVARGERHAPDGCLERAVVLLPAAATVPWWSILLGTYCGRMALALGDRQRAASLLLQARRELTHYPDSGVLSQLLAKEERALEAVHGGAGALRDHLTEAELRVLELAPTHLTLEEIGRMLSISRNTVKTHLKVIYSKLEVASRGEAVDRAHALGLIGRGAARA